MNQPARFFFQATIFTIEKRDRRLSGRTRHTMAIYHNKLESERRAAHVCDTPTSKQETFENFG